MSKFIKLFSTLAIILFLSTNSIFLGCAAYLTTMPSIIDGDLDLPSDRDLYIGFLDASIIFDNYAYLTFNDYLVPYRIDNKQVSVTDNIIMTPGIHNISVFYTQQYNDTVRYTLTPQIIDFDFEAGKFYLLNYTITKDNDNNEIITIFIEENNNVAEKLLQDINKAKNIFSIMNNIYNLNGTYTLETESHITRSTAFLYFTLDNDKIILYAQQNIDSNKVIVSGKYLMNDKWLIIFLNDITIKDSPWYQTDKVPTSPVAVRYIIQNNSLILQTPAWAHTFFPYAVKYNKIQ